MQEAIAGLDEALKQVVEYRHPTVNQILDLKTAGVSQQQAEAPVQVVAGLPDVRARLEALSNVVTRASDSLDQCFPELTRQIKDFSHEAERLRGQLETAERVMMATLEELGEKA